MELSKYKEVINVEVIGFRFHLTDLFENKVSASFFSSMTGEQLEKAILTEILICVKQKRLLLPSSFKSE